MAAQPQFWVRVLLLNDAAACTLDFASPFDVSCVSPDSNSQPQQRLSAGSPKWEFQDLDAPIPVTVSAGRINVAGQPFDGNEVTICPKEPHVFTLNGSDYRGTLKLILDPNGESFDAVNHIPLESYLAGVIGAEMPDYWESQALKAQTIAARTYCLYIKKRFGADRSWDLSKTQAHQVYRGIDAESTQIWNAVNQTEGTVLVCKQAPPEALGADAADDIFPAYYSSACGGHTENSKNVFGDSFEPLAGVPCPYCQDVARPKFFFWPMAEFDAADVTEKLLQRYARLRQLGQITDIAPAQQSDYAGFCRVTKVKLSGTAGNSDFLRAEDFRLTLDPTGTKLKSTICEIAKSGDKWVFSFGRGYGHGVGMCQCGAQAMARQGKTADQILAYYYPNSHITRLY
jgi:stage II sporulation protein D